MACPDMRVAVHLKVCGPNQRQPVPILEETKTVAYGVEVRGDREWALTRVARLHCVSTPRQDRCREHVRKHVE